jgi:hypothetical protein
MKKYGDIRANKEKAHAIPLLLNIETHFAVVNDPRQYGKVDHPAYKYHFYYPLWCPVGHR